MKTHRPAGTPHMALCYGSRLEDGCLVWTEARVQGYGFLHFGKRLAAHRLAYETWVGPIPPNMTIDHLCRNRACLWPEHLEVVTRVENILRGEGVGVRNGRKTHCDKGHPLSGDNLRVRFDKTRSIRGRVCIMCARARIREATSRFKVKNPELVRTRGRAFAKAKRLRLREGAIIDGRTRA